MKQLSKMKAICLFLCMTFFFSCMGGTSSFAKESYDNKAIQKNADVQVSKIKAEKSKKSESKKNISAIESGFRYIVNNNCATVTAYVGSSNSISIPNTLGGYPVKFIDNSFEVEREDLYVKSLSLPKNLEYIDSSILGDLYGLTNITVDSGNQRYISKGGVLYTKDMKSLVGIAFNKKVTTFNVPSGVENIESFNNFHIKVLNIPSSVKYLPYENEEDYFTFYDSLQKINVSSSNKYYYSYGGVLYNKSKTYLIMYPDSKKDKSYKIPNSVNKLSYFSNDYLENITLPDNLSKGYNEVFDSFENLKSISVSKKSKNYYSKSGVLFNKEKDTLLYYPSNKRSKKYTIPNSVKKVAEGSISNIYLQELVISRNVTKIGDENLSEGNLKKVTVLSPNVNYGYMCFDENRGKIKFYGLLNSTTQKFAKNNKFFFKAIKLKYPTVKVKSTKKKTAIISYKKVSGANKYNIYRKTTKGKYKLIKTTNKSSYKDKGLKSKKTYYYKVKAIGSKLKSDTSKAVKVKIK
ncbi:leucine-rich repeat protein [uncultured Anaerofustis sp.]|uniref:leucine-rich repeat protein n=1 Tax=uncultured Anaerofustis sp. TaxID=904996 RepID=UPI0025F16EAB|nr:leucine-rich repeat protein [uncultured Anaerofustis sp.]